MSFLEFDESKKRNAGEKIKKAQQKGKKSLTKGER